ncbi:Predicted arabinose efflux permease, MFS family [Formivibrio citricus]|uniref:Predicted arabinose efflux permease, MFS family n=1 Tax=Formivibrio citricus TaxID=83765 RepID=A0A1I5E160_9NEIS|nr:MFS transporter [Formivibrio citricus]SFO05199.1 Predicted arabinose efflux permease, MFS family [Formivibrio citricus]
MPPSSKPEALWTPAFVLICLANFLTFFAFYLLLPVLPAYLLDEFHASRSVSGAVLGVYTLSALLIRPVSGYVVDTVSRKPLHAVGLLIFVGLFAGYPVAGTLLAFTLLRAFHGMAFGMVTTSGSTLAIDVMPASRRGEGIAFFGLTGSLAMAFGPMSGLFAMKNHSYHAAFVLSLIAGILSWIMVLFIRAKPHQRTPHSALSLDRFFLLKGAHGSVSLLLSAFLYGVLLFYVVLFAREVGLENEAGYFFVLMALGVGLSRFGSGKLIDKGHGVQLIVAGKVLLFLATAVFALWPTHWVFNIGSILIGMGCGVIGPCYQSLFVDLAQHNQRGTANSTFYTAWDLGIGSGVLIGGATAQWLNYGAAILFGALLVVMSLIYFLFFTASHYKANKCPA